MILLFDSECCNLGSVSVALNKIGVSHIISNNIEDLKNNINILVLPGVGSYDSYIDSLKTTGFFEEIKRLVSNKNIRLLGICSGAQVLFESSEEGTQNGFGFLSGRVKKISSNEIYPLPHIGWNNIKPCNIGSNKINVEKKLPFYFCHSYKFPETEFTIAHTHYGEEFPVIVSNHQITAIQFHPEKSYSQGLELLRNLILEPYAKTKNNTSTSTV